MNLFPPKSTWMVTSLKSSTCCTGWTLSSGSTCFPAFLWFLSLICTRRKLQSALASVTSDPPPTSVIELRTSFRRRLVKFRQQQVKYQPEAASLVAQLPGTGMDVGDVQTIPLYLPSSLPADVLDKCSERLVSMETELRIGQCRDSLAQLRTKLTAQARLLKYKYVHVRHQASNTRSRNLLNRVNAKVDATAAKYRYAFGTLKALDPKGKLGWRSQFLELWGQDVRYMSQAELPDAPTRQRAEQLQAKSLLSGKVVPEGNRTVSWIWRGSLKGNAQDGPSEYDEGLDLRFNHANVR